jgi:hypothetical protein
MNTPQLEGERARTGILAEVLVRVFVATKHNGSLFCTGEVAHLKVNTWRWTSKDN